MKVNESLCFAEDGHICIEIVAITGSFKLIRVPYKKELTAMQNGHKFAHTHSHVYSELMI